MSISGSPARRVSRRRCDLFGSLFGTAPEGATNAKNRPDHAPNTKKMDSGTGTPDFGNAGAKIKSPWLRRTRAGDAEADDGRTKTQYGVLSPQPWRGIVGLGGENIDGPLFIFGTRTPGIRIESNNSRRQAYKELFGSRPESPCSRNESIRRPGHGFCTGRTGGRRRK
jgi:hypothetical protein